MSRCFCLTCKDSRGEDRSIRHIAWSIRLLLKRWFCDNHCLTIQDTFGEIVLSGRLLQLSSLSEKMVLSELSREKIVLLDWSRPLGTKWFCHIHCLNLHNYCWEYGSIRLIIRLVTTLDEKMDLLDTLYDLSRLLIRKLFCQTHRFVMTLGEKIVLWDSLPVTQIFKYYPY